MIALAATSDRGPGRGKRRRRTSIRWVAVAVIVAGAGCTPEPATAPGPPPGAPTVEAMADALGSDVVWRLVRGYVPDRSGEIALVPEPWSVLGQWTGGLRGADDPRTTHATPWSYHQRVPIVLYGPGFVPAGVRSEREVDVADLAPTVAGLLGLEFRAEAESLLEPNPGGRRPRVVVVVAFDGGGWNVLERWPRAWPTQRRLAAEGTVYTNATVGSSPSVTAPIHANMGTGTYPRTHGLAENTVRLPGGEIGEIYFKRADPRLLAAPTVADAWDRAREGRPWVGMVGFESWHLGMMGAGAAAPGGDRDVAVLWHREEFRYWTNEEVYRLPRYLPDTGDLWQRVRQLDQRDGAADGRWMGNAVDPEDTFRVPGSPAFVRHQLDTAATLLRREPIGTDDETDLLFLEFKSSDYAGHVWNMLSTEVRQVVAAQDRALGGLLRLLDRLVGRGRYVVALTADHGQSPVPEGVGGVRIDRFELERDIEGYFGADIVDAVHPSEAYLDVGAMRRLGISIEDVARYVGDYRYRDGVPQGTDLRDVARSLLERRVFAGALPGTYLRTLSAEAIDALGASDWPEGDLSTPPDLEGLLVEPRVTR